MEIVEKLVVPGILTAKSLGKCLEFNNYKLEVIQTLRGRSKSPLRDEQAAWEAIQAAVKNVKQVSSPPALYQLVYTLGLIYADQTGALPAYTNSDNETLFERFADAVVKRVAPRATRNQLRSAIRKIDARHNLQFKADLENFTPGPYPKRLAAE